MRRSQRRECRECRRYPARRTKILKMRLVPTTGVLGICYRLWSKDMSLFSWFFKSRCRLAMQNAARCLCSSRRRNKSLSSFGLKRELLLLVVKCDAGYKVQRSHTLVLTINLKEGIIDDDGTARAAAGSR